MNIGLTHGRALQRLMRYHEAMDQFLRLGKLQFRRKQYKDGIEVSIASATCALRYEDIIQATSILQEAFDMVHVELLNDTSKRAYCDLCGMFGTVLWMNSLNETAPGANSNMRVMNLLKSGSKYFYLYRWLSLLASRHQSICSKLSTNKIKGDLIFAEAISLDDENYSHIGDLSSINVSPFDEPQNIVLDNKLMLHHLLSGNNNASAFWPLGFNLPKEAPQFSTIIQELERTTEASRHWILKDPAGYGSHGNIILSGAEALSMSKNTEGYLCQQIVPKPLLIKERTFSIRMYVVYFGGSANSEAYISREGLVKLAATKFDLLHVGQNNELMDDILMTNSARGDDMDQYDLKFLESHFCKNDWSYDLLWQKLRYVVTTVMRAYCEESERKTSSQSSERVDPKIHLAPLHLPKIYGFDLLVDEGLSPWLIEVNRFPGLEPRNEKDRRVKQAVVEAAWRLAAEKLNVPLNIMGLEQQENISVFQNAKTEQILDHILF